jgi:hypothetical protein
LAVRPPPAGRLAGVVNERLYEAQWWVWRRLVPVRLNSIGDVVTVPSVALQWRTVMEKTVPAGLTSWCSPA